MQGSEKLLNWKYLTFVGLQTLNYMLFYVSYPVIPKYAVSIGFDLAHAGVLAGAFAVAALFARPAAGYCNDHAGRKQIMIAAFVICGLSTLALSLTDKHWILLILRLAYGAAFSFSSTMLVSCATDYIPESRIAEGIGYVGLGISLASAVGMPIGLKLASDLGMKRLFMVMGVLNILSAAVVIFVPVVRNEKPADRERFSVTGLFELRVLIYSVLVLPFSFSVGFVNSFFALTAESRNIAGYSVFFSIVAVAMMLVKPLSGKAQDRWGLSAVLIPAFILSALAAGIIAVSHTLALMIIAALCQAAGQGSGQPALQAKSVSSIEHARRGVALSTFYLGVDLGTGIGNIAGSRIASAFGYEGAYLFCSAMLILGLVIYLVHEAISRRRAAGDGGEKLPA